MLQIPQPDRPQVVQRDDLKRRLIRCRRLSGNLLRGLADDLVAIEQFDLKGARRVPRRCRTVEVAANLEGATVAEHILRHREDVVDVRTRNYPQPYLAVNAAEGEVIDLVAKWRNVGPLGRVDIDGKKVVAIEVHVRSEFERKRRVAAFVFAKILAVDPNSRGRHNAFEVHEDALALGLRRQFERTAVEGHELVRLFVEAVPGLATIGVRNHHLIEAGVVKLDRMPAVNHLRAVSPVTIDRQHKPSLLGTCRLGARCSPSRIAHGMRRQCSTRKQSSALHQKIASIHLLLTPHRVNPALLVALESNRLHPPVDHICLANSLSMRA